MKNKKERKHCSHLRGWRCCLACFRLAEIDICSHESYYKFNASLHFKEIVRILTKIVEIFIQKLFSQVVVRFLDNSVN